MSQSNRTDKANVSDHSAHSATQDGAVINPPPLPGKEKVKTKHKIKSDATIEPEKPSTAKVKQWIEDSSYNLVALIGYSLLGLSLVDFADVLLPLRLFDSNWQYQTITLLAGKVWAPLLGMMLVFFRRGIKISRSEVKLLGGLSWLSLAIAIAYFLMVPLVITNAFRVDQNNNTQANNQILQRSAEIADLQEQVERANTPQQIATIYATINRLPGIPQLDDPQAVKQQILDNLTQTEVSLQANAQANIKITQRSLIKNSLRVVLTVTIAGLAFLGVWRQSKWARQYRIVRQLKQANRSQNH
jgi:cell division protein FtsL